MIALPAGCRYSTVLLVSRSALWFNAAIKPSKPLRCRID